MPSDKNSNNLSKQGVGVFGALVAGQLGQQVFFNGLQKANEDFLKAIIRYSEFEELHFFLEASELEVQKAHWQPYIEEHGSNKEVLFISVGLLPDYLANQIYQVFHKGDPYIAELAGLRNSCSKVFFPITGRAHTLSTDSNLSKSRDLILSDIKKCDAILCSSEPQRQVMENLLLSASQSISEYTGASLSYRGKLSLLPLGIEADSQRAHDKGEARKQLGYAPDQFVLLSIGRFSPSDKMDLHPLLLAANELLEEKNITNFILILAGDGDAAGDYVKSLLQQLYELNLERRVRFELSIDEEQKALLFEAADAYISLADNVQESFGLAPIEAMNYSVPVILSDWNGYKELIENEKSGFLIETVSSDHDLLTRAINPLHPGLAHLIEAQGSAINIDSLVEKLELLIRDSALCEQLGYSAKKRVQKLFDWRLIIKNYHELVENLNQQAVALKEKSVPSSGFSFYHLFGHYPTSDLSDKAYLISTDRAVRVLLMVEKGFHFPTIHHLLNRHTIEALVLFCLEGKRVKEIREAFSSVQALDFIVVWMCKYQLAKIAGSKPESVKVKSNIFFLSDSDKFKNDHFDALLSNIESRRAVYIRPVFTWINRQIASSINSLDVSDGRLLRSILKSQITDIDEKLLQAIAWYGKDHQLTDYTEILDKLDNQGGLKTLQTSYPHWNSLSKKMLVSLCKGIRQLFNRLANDLPEINNYFGENWPVPATGVVDIKLPVDSHFSSVVVITFDNGEKLVYKARDIRIDYMVVGDGRDPVSLGNKLNQWLGSFPGVGVYRLLPKVEKRSHQETHYGYCEFLQHTGLAEELTDSQAKEYYQRQGVVIGLAMLLGLSDLHQLNLITRGSVPYLIDLERAFHSGVFIALEREIKAPSMAFIQGITDTSLEKTSIPNIWQQFHTNRTRLCDVELNDGALSSAQPLEWLPVTTHIVKTRGSHNLENIKSGSLAAFYAEDISEGIKVAVNAICDHRNDWFDFLESCRSVQVRFQPLISYDEMRQRLRDLHVFRGFQSFSRQRLKGYFLRVAKHAGIAGEESQKWLDAKWHEPISDLADGMATEWLAGRQVTFIKYPGNNQAFLRNGFGGIKKLSLNDKGYFQTDCIQEAKTLFDQLAANPVRKEQFLEQFTAMLQQWLKNNLQPGRELPDKVREMILAELESA